MHYVLPSVWVEYQNKIDLRALSDENITDDNYVSFLIGRHCWTPIIIVRDKKWLESTQLSYELKAL